MGFRGSGYDLNAEIRLERMREDARERMDREKVKVLGWFGYFGIVLVVVIVFSLICVSGHYLKDRQEERDKVSETRNDVGTGDAIATMTFDSRTYRLGDL